MGQARCSFCGTAQGEVAKLYSRAARSGRARLRICSECSEDINFLIRTELAFEGRVYQPDDEFPAIARHRFPLRGPEGQSSEAIVEIGVPYVVDDHSAACPVSVTGPIPVAWHHVRGHTTLQALVLPICWDGARVHCGVESIGAAWRM